MPLALFLLEKGADPNIRGKGGRTALDIARENNFPEIVKILESKTEPVKLTDEKIITQIEQILLQSKSENIHIRSVIADNFYAKSFEEKKQNFVNLLEKKIGENGNSILMDCVVQNSEYCFERLQCLKRGDL